uniref:Acyl carrier protein n=1 Tax=Aceria tosichella TaxID=561515 RepID=A0A6G1SA10_9ACAR
MNSILGIASRILSRPILERALLKRPAFTGTLALNKRWAHNAPLTYDFVRERILLVLRLYDKVNPEKLTLDSHFVNDLGLDSLDHVEIIMELENEFNFDIPDKDAETLVTPRHILKYIVDKEECYEELQHHDHHDDHGHGDHGHGHDKHVSAGSHHDNSSLHPQTRGFCSLSTISKRFMSDGKKYPTSFFAKPPTEIKIEDIQARVMKVCSKYDKIDSEKLDLTSHFVQDLGLDSLDHVEIMMELEDEFGLEIPDQDAEKLMRPVEIAKYIFRQEEKRAFQPEDRPL